MRHVDKGMAPNELSGDASDFQIAALRYALGQPNGKFERDLRKHAVLGSDGTFAHYGSALFTIHNYYSQPGVKRELISSHHGKCVFCESFIMDVDVGDVEHFRPKAAVTKFDEDDKNHEIDVDHTGYFWLSQTWTNLFLSCKQCNQAYKRNFFDVWLDGPRATIHDTDVIETPLLLTPDLPDEHLRKLIRFDPRTAKVLLNPGEMFQDPPDRAVSLPVIQRTIDIVGLNRRRLVEARANHLVKLRALFCLVVTGGAVTADAVHPGVFDVVTVPDTLQADALVALERAVDPTAEYSALAQDALEIWGRELKFERMSNLALANHQRNVLRFVITTPRLDGAVTLAENVRIKNDGGYAKEAKPRYDDIDDLYTAALQRYKDIVKQIRKNRATLTLARQTALELRDSRKTWYQTSPLKTSDDELHDLQARQARIELLARDTAPTLEAWQANAARIAQINAQRELGDLAPAVKEADRRQAQIDVIEKPLDVLWDLLVDLLDDVYSISAAYQRAGATRAARIDRCRALRDAVSNLADTVHENMELTDAVRQHLEQDKGYPAAIRK